MKKKRILVFEEETTEYGVDVLVPVEVPEGTNIGNVGKWLAGLHNTPRHHYTVMIVSEVYDFHIKERPKVLYAESEPK